MNEIKWGEVKQRLLWIVCIPLLVVWVFFWLLFNEPSVLILPTAIIALLLFLGFLIGASL